MALVPLVDHRDNILGFRERSELRNEDCWRITGIWIINSKNEALLTVRSKLKKVGAGLIDLSVAGTVEGEDSYYDTIVREVKEELGVTLTTPIIPSLKGTFKNRELGTRICQWFIACEDIALSELTLQAEEVDKAYWQPIPSVLADIEANPTKYVSHIGKEVLEEVLRRSATCV
jgi:isopentenyldiphosphate isomerase